MKPPPIPNKTVDEDLNSAATRLWSRYKFRTWFQRVAVGAPEPCIHLYVKKYDADHRPLIRNGWSGFRVIIHYDLPKKT